MIQLENVTKTYPEGVQAVCNLSLRVDAGETLVLVGTSGSGKTTALKMINRLIDPSSGRICVEGRDIRLWDPIELRRRIGYVIQSVGLFPHDGGGQRLSCARAPWSEQEGDADQGCRGTCDGGVGG